MNIDALFTDETSAFRIPPEPCAGEMCTIRFRTAKDDVSFIYIISGNLEKRMDKEDTDDPLFDYYSITFRMPDRIFRYTFEVTSGLEMVYYDKTGMIERTRPSHPFQISPGFSTPKWSQGAVMYQIFTDRFCNGNPDNDVKTGEYAYINEQVEGVDDWESMPKAFDVGRFYGGDLQGVRKKLDYIQKLGVEVIYFNPLFVSPSNHKYDTQDYEHIDPHLAVIKEDGGECLPEGSVDNKKATKYRIRTTSKENLEASDAYFADLVKEIHARGMKVILDGVFNHCGSFNKWMDREGFYEGLDPTRPGAFTTKHSPYQNYFSFRKDEWPNNTNYEGWWDNDTLPKLNYDTCPELFEEILRIAVKWVSPPYCVDGWRLDVAADLGHDSGINHHFWQRFRKAVKEANPDALILAEHYGDPSAWLQGNEWDSVMNYDAFMEPVTYFLTGMEKHSDDRNDFYYGNGDWFFRTMKQNMSKFYPSSLLSAMNELSNHDHSRFLTRTNRMVGRVGTLGCEAAGQNVDKGVFREAVVIQATWPGCPTIYYGDEAGVCGWTDPDNRRTYPWGKEDLELIEFHSYLFGMRKHIPCLKTGSLMPLLAGHHVIAYGRFQEDSAAIVVINNSLERKTLHLPVWQMGLWQETLLRIMCTYRTGYNVGRWTEEVKDGYLDISIGPVTSMLFRTMGEDERS